MKRRKSKSPAPFIHRSAVVYISGPMRGCIKKNFPKFFAVEKYLTETYGCKVLNPARITDAHVARYHRTAKGHAKQRQYAWHDIDLLFQASHIFLFDEWQTSYGAQAEFHLALWLKLEVLHEQELIP